MTHAVAQPAANQWTYAESSLVVALALADTTGEKGTW